MVRIYAALCVLGTVVPLAFLGSFVAAEAWTSQPSSTG
jgi:hypothetical protein